MANFKYRVTNIGTSVDHFVENLTDSDIVAAYGRTTDRFIVARAAFTENDSLETSPHAESVAWNTLEDGRIQRVKLWTGFETQAEVESFINYAHRDNPDGAILAAAYIANDVRTKIEILDDNNAVIRLVHDNTTLDQHAINGYTVRPEDPFYVPA